MGTFMVTQREYSIRRLKELHSEWMLMLMNGLKDGNPEKERVRMAILWLEDNIIFGD